MRTIDIMKQTLELLKMLTEMSKYDIREFLVASACAMHCTRNQKFKDVI